MMAKEHVFCFLSLVTIAGKLWSLGQSSLGSVFIILNIIKENDKEGQLPTLPMELFYIQKKFAYSCTVATSTNKLRSF